MALLPALGTARSARMVGWAMNASHGKDEVPAHRVVNRNGLLTGNSILTVQISCSNY
jgi:methylated-DNA-protein-cysteine methyltransferase-like protein